MTVSNAYTIGIPAFARATWRADAAACALILAGAAFLLLPLFWNGPPAGHSSHLNWGWARGFADALREGVIYPRWLVDMSQGRGSPAFYFYAPAPFYLIAPILLALPAEQTWLALSLGHWLILGLSGLACYALLRQAAGVGPAAAGAIVYMALPYHYFTDIWIRAAMAEQAAFIALPLCALFAGRIPEPRAWLGLAASYALLVTTHLPSALLAAPFIAVWVIFEAIRVARPELVLRGAAAGALGIGLAGIYLLPALSSQHLVHSELWWTHYYSFRTWTLLSARPSAGEGLVDWIELGLAATTVAFLAALLAVSHDRTRLQRLLPWCTTVCGAWFLMTPASEFLWASITPLAKVQFPWRAMPLVELSLCVALAAALETLRAGAAKWRPLLAAGFAPLAFVLALGASLYVLPFARQSLGEARTDAAAIAFRADGTEYLPRAVPLPPGEKPMSTDKTPAVRAPASPWVVPVEGRGHRLAFRVEQPSAGPAALPVFYFPAWRASVDGALARLEVHRNTGLTAIEIAAGEHRIDLRLAPFPAERLGLALTALSAALWCITLAAGFRRRKRLA